MPTSLPQTSLDFDLVLPSLIAVNQKQLLRSLAQEISGVIGIGERILNDRLVEKEKESPSAMGEGLSILHLHISGLKQPFSMFARLKNGIPMSAPDNKDVDLVCVLLTPEREGAAYLRTMARISRLLRDAQICVRLRSTQDEKAIRAILEAPPVQRIAA
ncbi:MAG: transcriptional regulator [Micavibrio aeruginosavorus]|uniref:Transcriptional regulator n=1 Tax=Micavibrio aeruginosavorus TaxID=349221 RepID=A0A2W5N167_9BACT|nr:MAG: transcriptional regulator [Micavibrio aeruginosavorus]